MHPADFPEQETIDLVSDEESENVPPTSRVTTAVAVQALLREMRCFYCHVYIAASTCTRCLVSCGLVVLWRWCWGSVGCGNSGSSKELALCTRPTFVWQKTRDFKSVMESV